MWIFIKPVDTICCRDGRPFSAGEDVVAKTLFPPLPSTSYGALRTFILSNSKYSFDEFHKQTSDLNEVGTPHELGTLCTSGPIVAKKDEMLSSYEYFFPIPAHLVQDKDNEDNLYKLTPNTNVISANEVSDLEQPLSLIKGPDNVTVKEVEGHLNLNGTVKILHRDNEIPDIQECFKSDKFFQMSWHVGLARQFGARTAKEGQLYSIGHYYPTSDTEKSTGFMVKVAETNCLPDKGMLKLGGESRAVFFEKIEKPPFQEQDYRNIAEVIAKKNRFFLWLITPAIFKTGFVPTFINNNFQMTGTFEGMKVKLIAAQVGRKKFVGGFQFGVGSSGQSKSGYWAVPAGSVYFFEILDQINEEKILEFVEKKMLSAIDGQIKDMAQQGFGTTLIGGY
jgi:CRISPR-associated protein Cmr3